jgi:uncharacterized RmlC-like cupin family protein
MKITINSCILIFLPKFNKRTKGNLTFIDNTSIIPFSIKRIFYLYDIPGGESRGAHAHKKCKQFLIATSGSFNVELNDGINKKKYELNSPDFGLYIPPGIWASEVDFSPNSTCLVLTSDIFDENDYIRNYKDYLKMFSN